MKLPSNKIIEQWLNDVNDAGEDLTAWESQFMESITEQFERKGGLSERQIEILERIYTEKVK